MESKRDDVREPACRDSESAIKGGVDRKITLTVESRVEYVHGFLGIRDEICFRLGIIERPDDPRANAVSPSAYWVGRVIDFVHRGGAS